VQFANVIQETEGLDCAAAVQKASIVRLRPILMTTGAMVFGAVPLVLAAGPGSVSRVDMGLIIASGLAIGALFLPLCGADDLCLLGGGQVCGARRAGARGFALDPASDQCFVLAILVAELAL